MPRLSRPALLLALLGATGMGLSALACGPAGPAGPAARHGGEASLPFYEGDQADLFDDGIEGAAVGLDLGGTRGALRNDPVLRERAHLADGIIRARLKTVSGNAEGPDAAFLLTLEPIERLGGKRAPTVELALKIDRTSRAFGLVRAKNSEMVGKTFIVFVRQFSGVPPVWHAHLAPDTKEVESAVKEAAALFELR